MRRPKRRTVPKLTAQQIATHSFQPKPFNQVVDECLNDIAIRHNTYAQIV